MQDQAAGPIQVAAPINRRKEKATSETLKYPLTLNKSF